MKISPDQMIRPIGARARQLLRQKQKIQRDDRKQRAAASERKRRLAWKKKRPTSFFPKSDSRREWGFKNPRYIELIRGLFVLRETVPEKTLLVRI